MKNKDKLRQKLKENYILKSYILFGSIIFGTLIAFITFNSVLFNFIQRKLFEREGALCFFPNNHVFFDNKITLLVLVTFAILFYLISQNSKQPVKVIETVRTMYNDAKYFRNSKQELVRNEYYFVNSYSFYEFEMSFVRLF